MGFLSMLNPWKWGTIGLGIALVVCAGWGVRVNSLRAGWQDKYTTLDGQAASVLIATRQATDNPGLKWENVPAQITELASSNILLKTSITGQNIAIDNMTTETQRLKLAGDALRSQLSAAQIGRQSVLDRLKAMSAAPGDRQSCPAMLSQTQDALDLAYGSGL